MLKNVWVAQFIEQKINELVHVTMSAQDFPTFNFLQWYVAEQHEEEKLTKSIPDRLTPVGYNVTGRTHH